MIWILVLFGVAFLLMGIIIYKYIQSVVKYFSNKKFKEKLLKVKINKKINFHMNTKWEDKIDDIEWEEVIPKTIKFIIPSFVILIVMKSLIETIIGLDSESNFSNIFLNVIPLFTLIAILGFVYGIYRVFINERLM
jgi:large-conductance mechanosensitive channel